MNARIVHLVSLYETAHNPGKDEPRAVQESRGTREYAQGRAYTQGMIVVGEEAAYDMFLL